MGGVGIVVERHEAVFRDNGFGSCYSFFASELCFLWYLNVSLTTFESGLLVQRLQQFLVGLEVDALDTDMLNLQFFTRLITSFITIMRRISQIFGRISNNQ